MSEEEAPPPEAEVEPAANSEQPESNGRERGDKDDEGRVEEDRRESRDKRDKSKDRDRKRRSRSRDRERRRSRSRERRRRSRSRERRRSRDTRRRSRSRDRRRSRSRDRRRSRSRGGGGGGSRRRRHSSDDGGYGYVPRRRGGQELDPEIHFQDPFAALRQSGPLVDPSEIARQMQEQQLRARQLVLQQQACSAVQAASKTQREVYVGNLAAGMVTAEMLRQLFNSTMTAAFPDKIEPGVDPVVNVSISTEGRYAFVELRTQDMATASLQLNGQVALMGSTLSIGRPSGYVDPTKAATAAQAAADALARFQAESQAARTEQEGEGAVVAEDTCYLRIAGMITAAVLEDDAEYRDVITEITEECNLHGTVLRVIVPRPPNPAEAATLLGTGSYGNVYVQFLDLEGAQKTKASINGRMFAGNTVEVEFMQPLEFMDAIAVTAVVNVGEQPVQPVQVPIVAPPATEPAAAEEAAAAPVPVEAQAEEAAPLPECGAGQEEEEEAAAAPLPAE